MYCNDFFHTSYRETKGFKSMYVCECICVHMVASYQTPLAWTFNPFMQTWKGGILSSVLPNDRL